MPSRRPRSPTISEVARIAGVSLMTVSRVINGAPSVRAATKTRVQDAMRSINYTPNPAARSLAGVEAIRLGFVYGNPSLAYLNEALVGALAGTARETALLNVQRCDSAGEASELEIVQRLIESGVSGILLPAPISEQHAVVQRIAQAEIELVTLGATMAASRAGQVGVDDERGAYDMGRRLIACGHRSFGIVTGHPNQLASSRRFAGFLRAVSEAGLVAPSTACGYFTFAQGLVAAETLLQPKRRPSAIFACNDDMAAAVISVAQRRGLALPDDLSVCGFDDTLLATNLWPALTTVRQPAAEVADRAVSMLVRRIRRRKAGEIPGGEVETLPHEIVWRASVADLT